MTGSAVADPQVFGELERHRRQLTRCRVGFYKAG